MDHEIVQAMGLLAERERVLVACDFDGTLAEIVSAPGDARPAPGAAEVLADAAALPGVVALVISGRSLADLGARLGEVPGVHRIGSHGLEASDLPGEGLTAEERDRRARIERVIREAASSDADLFVETKPASVALHYRNADAESGARAVRRVLDALADDPGVVEKRGKMVLELVAARTDKGRAIEAFRDRHGLPAMFFAGDDVTDEDAFGVARRDDVTVKVGEGATRAAHRVPAPADVVALLRRFVAARADRPR